MTDNPQPQPSRDDRTAIVARDPVVHTREQLEASGATRVHIDAEIRKGRLHRIHPGVYLPHDEPFTWHARALADQSYVDRQARRKWDGQPPRPVVAVTGTTAAHLHGIPHLDEEPGATVLATNPESRSKIRRVVLLPRTTLTEHDVETVRGVPVTDLTWTVMELVVTLLLSHAMNIVADLVRSGRLSLDELAALAGRVPEVGHHVRALLRELTEPRLRARSEAERRLYDLIVTHGLLPPIVNHLLTIGRRTLELDFAWPDLRIEIELDGPHHLDPAQRARDRERDALLRAAGWTVLRIPLEDLERDPDGVVALIATLLASHPAG